MGRGTSLSAVGSSRAQEWACGPNCVKSHLPTWPGAHYFERVLTGDWVYVAALAASFTVATVATPAGVSGAVLLLPFQVGVLGTPSPSVTPTNLLYNVVATPGALYRYWRQGQTGGRLTRLLVLGTLPGVIVGSVIRVELLPSETSFDVVIACVLIPLGAWLLMGRTSHTSGRSSLPPSIVVILAAAVGCIGGIYGIGGGAILAPVLIGSGPRHLGINLRHLGSGCRHILGAFDPPRRLDRPRLESRDRARNRRTTRWVYRRSAPTACSRIRHPSPPRPTGSRDWHSIHLDCCRLNLPCGLGWPSGGLQRGDPAGGDSAHSSRAGAYQAR
jgi:hypothetical protein